jgi:hypothetical protein
MATSTLTQQVGKLLDEKTRALIMNLPNADVVKSCTELSSLKQELEELEDTLRQRKGLLKPFGLSIPETQVNTLTVRAANIRGRLRVLLRVAKAIYMGYEPYTPPTNWYAGFVEPGDRVRYSAMNKFKKNPDTHLNEGTRGLSWGFSAPMPKAALVSYKRARKSGLFACFIGCAPSRDLFSDIIPSLNEDPVVISYIATQGDNNLRFGQPFKEVYLSEHNWTDTEVQPGLIVEGGVGFLVHAWGHKEDRRAAGLNF